MPIKVTCSADTNPSANPRYFDDMPQAMQWAQWGHCCLADHTYTPVNNAGYAFGCLGGRVAGAPQDMARFAEVSRTNDEAPDGTVLAEWFRVTNLTTGFYTEFVTMEQVESFTGLAPVNWRVDIIANPCHCEEAAIDCECGR